ncbi:MAG: hypothetical protein J7L11_08675 [Thermoprotei archaeon]|nr:hypothetical protein [Thermoprotei archaeon]
MAKYTWGTLLALYDRLSLRDRLRLRALNEYICLPPELSDAIKIPVLMLELIETVRDILRQLQMLITEEVKLSRGGISGRILVKLIAKHYPSNVPIAVTRTVIETAANLLTVITILEVLDKLYSLIDGLSSYKVSSALEPLQRRIIKRLRDAIGLCGYLLHDPFLRPLVPKARAISRSPAKIRELEQRVRLELIQRPREYRAYRKLLRLRRSLHEQLRIMIEISRDREFIKSLTLDIRPDKLYELFCFTLLLQTIVESLDVKEAHIDQRGRVLILECHPRRPKGRPSSLRVRIAYNAIPQDIESRFRAARAYGILNHELDASSLHGLPDTLMLIEKESPPRKRIVIDYKYTRDLSYLVQARFKALAYLYEFSAHNAVLITPSPISSSLEDEEIMEHEGFYRSAVRHKGAIIELENGRRLILVYIDPLPKLMNENINAVRKLMAYIMTEETRQSP